MLTGAWLEKTAMAGAYYVAGVSALAIVVAFLPLAYKAGRQLNPQLMRKMLHYKPIKPLTKIIHYHSPLSNTASL